MTCNELGLGIGICLQLHMHQFEVMSDVVGSQKNVFALLTLERRPASSSKLLSLFWNMYVRKKYMKLKC